MNSIKKNAITLIIGCLFQTVYSQSRLENLEVFKAGYPRSFMFWYHTRDLITNTNLSNEQLDKEFMKLNGINSPCDNWTKIAYFKKKHPEKLTFLFIQGSVVAEAPGKYDPNVRTDFYDGHWVYYEGTKIVDDISIEQTEIPVQNAKQISVNEDVAMCALTVDGNPDWNYCEQLKCKSVNVEKNTITVVRGCYSTKAKTFSKLKSMALAHAWWDWGSPEREGEKPLSWTINYSTQCPKDKNGKNFADIMLIKLSDYFLPGGVLQNFDGLNFDLCYGIPTSTKSKGRKFDTNGDGIGDNGFFSEVNEFGIGVSNFHERLRNAFGNDRIITGDGGHLPNSHERLYKVQNGVESEWWPTWGDKDITKWSLGINFHHFVKQNSAKPYFTYINHKVMGESRSDGMTVPFNIHRLVFAAAQFTDAVLSIHPTCLPKAEPGDLYPVWDEIDKGVENKINWLGQPLTRAIRLTLSQKDLLDGNGTKINPEFLRHFIGEGLSFSIEKNAVKIMNSGQKAIKFNINNIPVNGSDLFIAFKIKTEDRKGYPTLYPRLCQLKSSSGKPDQSFYANSNWFESGISFREVSGNSINLTFEVAGEEALWLSDFKVFAHPDAMYRVFENGIVLANPSDHNFEFDLSKIAPNTVFKHIQASLLQDLKTNNGTEVGSKVTLGARDGLFLVKK